MQFVINSIFFTLFSLYYTSLTTGMIKKNVIMFSTVVLGTTFLCMGPSQLFHFPDSLYIITFSQCLQGQCVFIIIAALPEMISSVSADFPESQREILNDVSNGIFNMFLGIGMVLGPIFGSIITQLFGYKNACDSVAIIAFVTAASYWLFTRKNTKSD